MDNKVNFSGQSMDDIVFDCRNKTYGAYVLRYNYQKHLLRAICITVGLFVFGLYSPKVANAMGLFKHGEEEILRIDTIVAIPKEIPEEKKEEKLEEKIDPPKTEEQPTTVRYQNAIPVDKDSADKDPLVRNEDIDSSQIGDVNFKGKGPSTILPFTDTTGITTHFEPNKGNVDITHKAYFIGGEEAFEEFLKDNLVYPKVPKDNGIEGTTLVTFTVTEDGTVKDVKVGQTSADRELDDEAVRVIIKTNKMFKPGRIKGKTVKSGCQIPITFELEDE